MLGGELSLEVTYSRFMFDAADIDELQALLRAELQALVAYCLNTPLPLQASELPLLGLDQPQLDALPLPAGVEDLYPLSPMQQGMLFHALDVPGSSLYVNQLRVDLDGLDEARFLDAWRAVIVRHANLRTGFLASADAAPLQFVLREVQLPVQSSIGATSRSASSSWKASPTPSATWASTWPSRRCNAWRWCVWVSAATT